ncbi:MAG: 4Fe-4S binding protein [Candidatus Hydrogenedentota bacterium]|nr:MAG: 4Fe-4S binding protein [Candidatus Hydrogenedentota bacterium]
MKRVSRLLGSQGFRKMVQISVILLVLYAALNVSWRNFKQAHNSARIVGLLHGAVAERLYSANEALLSLFGDSYRATFANLGFPWTFRTFGIESVDPILALDLFARRHALSSTVLVGLILPLLIVLIAGKVFCSYFCPARLLFEFCSALRRGLIRLGLPLPEFHPPFRFGGWVLFGGLLASVAGAGSIWYLLLPYLSIAGSLFLAITGGTTGGLLFVVLGWCILEIVLAPGWACQGLCPTGFLLERFAVERSLVLENLHSGDCPRHCSSCRQACPYSLYPRAGTTAYLNSCDNCGLCVQQCPKDYLRRRWKPSPILPRFLFPRGTEEGGARRISSLALLLLFLPALVYAHHNKGLPHYGYFENYPQVPTKEYVEIHGRWEIGATIFNFQGLDRRKADTPNDVKIYLYIYDSESGANYSGPVDFVIRQGERVITRFHREKPDEELVYISRETLPRSGEYVIEAQLPGEAGGDVLPLRFEIKIAGEGWHPVWIIGGSMGILGMLMLGAYGRRRKIRKKSSNRRERFSENVNVEEKRKQE